MIEQRQAQLADLHGARCSSELAERIHGTDVQGMGIELVALQPGGIVLRRQEFPFQAVDLVPQAVTLREQVGRIVKGAGKKMRSSGHPESIGNRLREGVCNRTQPSPQAG